MELVVSGLLNKQIAGELRTSDFTIKVQWVLYHIFGAIPGTRT
jgi:DNA-binding NarL/FixJ family response regulator